MFSTMAGIRDDPASPGFRHFVLAPVQDERIGKVKVVPQISHGGMKLCYNMRRGKYSNFLLVENVA